MSVLERAPVRPGRGDAEILRDGRLGGFDPEELAARFGTPFYAYDLDVVERQVAALHSVLPSCFDLAYAVKANPSLGVVAHLGRLGLGADVASGGELETVLRAGIQPSQVVFTGPGKRDAELTRAVDAGIRAVTVESPGELARLEAAASAAGRRVSILLRAAATADRRLERVRLVGDEGAGKFGMGPDDLAASARRAVGSAHLELLGLHAFGASNVLDAAALADHIEGTVRAARSMAIGTGVPLRLVDAGGGLGIAYEEDQEALDLAEFGRRLAALARGWAGDPVTRDARILLEPGRFLVGPAGAYVARVVDRKSLDGRDVVILDGGIHHVLRPALVRQQHRVRALGQVTTDRTAACASAPVTIAGPLCSGLDVVSTDAMGRAPEVGELVAVLDVGAYGFTESMPLFLSHPTPAEVAVRRGRAQLLRPRVDPSAWLDTQANPDWA
ncbi:MAG: arginine decarboxylase [Chloroflexota bacterium]|nr:arginine decarboxylase [Chloroflexota bacterium]